MKQGTTFTLEVNPKIPRKLIRLEELANNLWYSWDKPTRTLVCPPAPWACGMRWAIIPRSFCVGWMNSVCWMRWKIRFFWRPITVFCRPMILTIMKLVRRNGECQLTERDLVAYFCAEFGFHESFPIYSGGLGILAGDHCKAASDMRVPFVAVGLLYRQGYFSQTIECDGGKQVATYADSDFNELPVTPALRDDGGEIHLTVELPGRQVVVKVWQAIVGHVRLYLLDTDLEENAADDRNITHQLYGGDRTLRMQQEIILGIGGVRALQALGIQAHGVAYQRRSCGIPDSGAGAPVDGRASTGFYQCPGGRCRQYGIYNAYTGSCRA